MAKKLTNKDKEQVQQLFTEGLDVSEIATKLDVKVQLVKDYLLQVFQLAHNMGERMKKEHKEAEEKKTVKGLMIMESRDKKRKGVAIMTREASARADAAKGIDPDKDINADEMPNDNGEAFRSKYSGAIAPATKGK